MFCRRRLPWSGDLRRQLGVPAWPRRMPSSPRSRVWRAWLDSADVVIKQISGGRDAGERFEREVTAMRRAGRLTPPVVPELLAVDPENRVLVMPFAEHQPATPTWVVDYATALARLHLAGIGVEPDPDRPPLPAWTPPGPQDAAGFLRLARGLGVAVPQDAPDELDHLLGRLARTRRSSLLHGDPCPDNVRLTASGVRFIDLEQAALGPGLTELAYLRMAFPTCWCAGTTHGRLIDRAEQAYRTTWQSLAGYPPPGDLTDACAGWLLRADTLVERARRDGADHVDRLLDQDWFWGTASARQRLAHRLRAVAGLTADRPDLAAVHHLIAGMLGRLPARWPHLTPLPSLQRSWVTRSESAFVPPWRPVGPTGPSGSPRSGPPRPGR